VERGPGGRLHPIDHAGGDMSADGVKIVPFRRGEAVLLDPSEAAKFVTGQEIFFSAGPPRWYVRLWRWIKRGFRKPHPPAVLTVIGVDRENGILMIEGE